MVEKRTFNEIDIGRISLQLGRRLLAKASLNFHVSREIASKEMPLEKHALLIWSLCPVPTLCSDVPEAM
jgi:hypothetical protein